jgi:hypothetical protein
MILHGDPRLKVTMDWRKFPPHWFTQLLNRYVISRKRRLTRGQAMDFVATTFHSSCLGIFDHYGTDGSGNVVAEPYAGNCATCLAFAAELAARLGLRHTVTPETWHAPHISECVRITFYKPDEQCL